MSLFNLRVVATATIFILLATALGCSDVSSSITPTPRIPDINSGGRVLFGYWDVSIEPGGEAAIVPVREASGHFNVLQFLENGPCTDCVQITGIAWSPGQVDVTVQLRHPFPGNPFFTGFDVRGICFLPGSFSYPGLVETMPDLSLENHVEAIPGAYLGYTDLYNPTDQGSGYLKGKLTPFPASMLTASVGAFQYYSSYPDNGNRNVFEVSDVVSNVYRIKFSPGSPIVFGYAVDASWAPPTGTPPYQIPDDFGPNANCLEAWKLDMDVDDSGLDDTGGSLVVTVTAFDHQGYDTIGGAKIECPELNPAVIDGVMITEDPVNNSRTFSLTVENVNLTALQGEQVQFLVSVIPIEETTLVAYNAGTATVGPPPGECPTQVHQTFFGKGEFGVFGNYPLPPTDAAILSAGQYAGEFLMCGNGFAGSMLGSYDISDLGPHDANGFVGLIGAGTPVSLDTAQNSDHIFLVMQLDGGDDINVYDTVGSGVLDSISAPFPVVCLDTTPDEDIWFITKDMMQYTLNHAILTGEWEWTIVPGDEVKLFSGLSDMTWVFDMIYEPGTGRIFIYHSYSEGSIDVYDASQPGPPVELTGLSQTAIWGNVSLDYTTFGSWATGADIELDLVNANFSGCRIVAFANFGGGGVSVRKYDSGMNILDTKALSGGPYSTFAIGVNADIGMRRLVFLPLNDFNADYYLYEPPPGW